MPVEVYPSLRETWETELFAARFCAKKKPLLPHVRERSEGRNIKKLESKLDGQLNAPRTATADERVADAHVARGGNNAGARSSGIAYFPPVHHLEAVDAWVCEEGWQVRIGKVGVIEEIEEIDAELHVKALSDRCAFVDREIELFERRTAQGIPAHITEVTRARNAVLR